MMLKLTMMNLKGFLTELAACCGGVTAEIAGAPVNLNNTAQLRRIYEQDGCLTLELNVSSPKDYYAPGLLCHRRLLKRHSPFIIRTQTGPLL